MVDSKAGGVAVGGAQGSANAGASEFSGANFTFVELDSASYDWTTALASTNTDSSLAGLCQWISQKATIVAVNGAAAGLVYLICEGPFGWGNSAAMQASIQATLANGGLGTTGALTDSAGTDVPMDACTAKVGTALILALA
tara:strand:- start:66 stop:488 length:423 start_codon:yes stop_codon:yes gene_type:complete